jgi:hypothetical protein
MYWQQCGNVALDGSISRVYMGLKRSLKMLFRDVGYVTRAFILVVQPGRCVYTVA